MRFSPLFFRLLFTRSFWREGPPVFFFGSAARRFRFAHGSLGFSRSIFSFDTELRPD